MNILTIPARNIRRKWGRTLLLLLVFTLGTASITALDHVSRVVGESLEKKLTAFGANILITPKTESLTVSYGGFSMGDLQIGTRFLDEEKITAHAGTMDLAERISAVAPKLVVMDTVGDTAVGIVGVRWEQERALKSYWGVTGTYPTEPGQVLAGEKAARALGLEPGRSIDILGRSFTVSGVLMQTGSDDDSVLLVSLPVLQELTGRPGQADFVEVSALCAGCPIDDIVRSLESGLPNADITPLKSIVKQRMYSITFVQRLILSVSVVILITACAMVGLSMLSSVNERRREIGILRSMGYTRGGVFSVFLAEALFIGAAAGIVGYFAGFGLSFRILDMLDIAEGAALVFEPGRFLLAAAGICVVTTLSSFIPARAASRVEPSQALVSL